MRVGLVTTNSVRGGASRKVLEPIADADAIQEAWADEPWVLDGAAVRVSMIGFGAGFVERRLEGRPATRINADLTGNDIDLTKALPLTENAGVAFIGDQKGGPFEIEGELARRWLTAPINPNGRANREVLRPWANGGDLTGRPKDHWIIDFGVARPEAEAALFELPFQALALRASASTRSQREVHTAHRWWLHQRPRPEMRRATAELCRVLVTPRVAKHRFFVWLHISVLPDSRLVCVARDHDCWLGLLSSRLHEVWSLGTASWHGVGNDPTYNAESCFETFPFPEGLTPDIPAADYADDPRAVAIAEAAAELNRLREAWLNPPDLVRIEPEVVSGYPDRVLPRDEAAAKVLKTRTLTNLYNQRPAWLDIAHKRLDAAVAAAYGWPADLSDDEVLERLFALNQERAKAGR